MGRGRGKDGGKDEEQDQEIEVGDGEDGRARRGDTAMYTPLHMDFPHVPVSAELFDRRESLRVHDVFYYPPNVAILLARLAKLDRCFPRLIGGNHKVLDLVTDLANHHRL